MYYLYDFCNFLQVLNYLKNIYTTPQLSDHEFYPQQQKGQKNDKQSVKIIPQLRGILNENIIWNLVSS